MHGYRGLNFGLYRYFVSESSEDSGESAHLLNNVISTKLPKSHVLAHW